MDAATRCATSASASSRTRVCGALRSVPRSPTRATRCSTETAATLTLKGKWAVIVARLVRPARAVPGVRPRRRCCCHGGGARGRAAEAAARTLWYPFWDAGFVARPGDAHAEGGARARRQRARRAHRAARRPGRRRRRTSFAFELARQGPRARGEAPVACRRRARRGGERTVRAAGPDRRDARAQPEGRRRRPPRLPVARLGGLGASVADRRARPGSSTAGVPRARRPRRARARPTPATPRRAGRAAPGDRRPVRPAHRSRSRTRSPGCSARRRRRRSLRGLGRRGAVGRLDQPRGVVAPGVGHERARAGASRRRDAAGRRRRGAPRRAGRRSLADEPVDGHVDACWSPRPRPSATRRSTGRRSRRLGEVDGDVAWGPEDREAFFRLLRGGPAAGAGVRGARPRRGCSSRLLPEWAHVRARPQRNAYHRFTVDRHLLEAVVECDELLDGDRGSRSDVGAPRADRELLLLRRPHSTTSPRARRATTPRSVPRSARPVATRIGLDAHARRRRGLARPPPPAAGRHRDAPRPRRRPTRSSASGGSCGDTERLDLLYALTVGRLARDRPGGVELGARPRSCRQLFVGDRHACSSDGGRRSAPRPPSGSPCSTATARSWSSRELAVEWAERRRRTRRVHRRRARPRAASSRPSPACSRWSASTSRARRATAIPTPGMALEVYRGIDRFGRLDEAGRRDSSTDAAQRARRRAAARGPGCRSASAATAGADRAGRPQRRRPVDIDASASATVVEVHAPDDVGLLASVAAVFADLDVDVSVALVSTLGERASTSSTSATPTARSRPTRSCSSGSGPRSSPGSPRSTCFPSPR